MFRYSPIAPESPHEEATVFYFVGQKLLVRKRGGQIELPGLDLHSHPSSPYVLAGVGRIEVVRSLFLGMLDGVPCRAVELRATESDGDRVRSTSSKVASSSSGAGQASGTQEPGTQERSGNPFEESGDAVDGELELVGLRSLIGELDEQLLRVAGIASQVLDWDRNHQFCGRCGTPTVPSEIERSRTCPECSLTAYPRISPAIIVAVVKGNKILLGRNRRYRTGRMFSVLAGFVEPGENLEQCVRREVMEEVSIEVGEIRYFASQPWPFPNSLMIAFTADYKSGEIKVDETEIIEADWFDRDHLPQVPPHGTVARRLIDWFAGR